MSQINVLRRGLDVAGTPGRIIDLINRGALVLSEIQFIVLDEADQRPNVGFDEDVEVIRERWLKRRQEYAFFLLQLETEVQVATIYLKLQSSTLRASILWERALSQSVPTYERNCWNMTSL